MAQIIEVPGYGQVEFPDGMSDQQIAAAIKSNMQPTKAPSGFAKGLRDPIDAGAQLLSKITPAPIENAVNRLNNFLADKTGMFAKVPEGGVDQMVREQEAKYQAERAAAGESGTDWGRAAGNVLNPANIAVASKIPQAATLAGRVGLGAASGGLFGMAQPVTQGDFATEKAKQAALGSVVGGAVPAVTGGVARLISPKASANPDVQMLRAQGVKPTIGQTMGGMPNFIEQKATSLPFVGDLIQKGRKDALDQFNRVAINRAVSPIGGQIDDIGHAGIKKAGDMLSKAYDDALNGLKGVTLDQQGLADIGNLKSMAQSMPMNKQFNSIFKNVVEKRLSPNGGMAAGTFKIVESELGNKAAKYGASSVASEQELGDALKEALRILRDQAARQNPQYADALAKANQGWANLVRIEGAGKASALQDGVFTPGKLMSAVRSADTSVRDRATARGAALMQDLAGAGQRVLGNTYPDSGTAGRLANIGVGAGLVTAPVATSSAIAGGALMYSPLMQDLLRNAVASRPQAAIPAANAIRNAYPFLIPGAVSGSYGLLGNSQ